MLLALRDWIDARLPIMRAWNTHMAKYYCPQEFQFLVLFCGFIISRIDHTTSLWYLAFNEF